MKLEKESRLLKIHTRQEEQKVKYSVECEINQRTKINHQIRKEGQRGTIPCLHIQQMDTIIRKLVFVHLFGEYFRNYSSFSVVFCFSFIISFLFKFYTIVQKYLLNASYATCTVLVTRNTGGKKQKKYGQKPCPLIA